MVALRYQELYEAGLELAGALDRHANIADPIDFVDDIAKHANQQIPACVIGASSGVRVLDDQVYDDVP